MSQNPCLTCRESAQHDVRHGDVDERFAGGRVPFVIFGKPPIEAEPAEGALHYPPSREYPEQADFISFDDFNGEVAGALDGFDELPRVALVGEYLSDAFELCSDFDEYGLGSNSVGERCFMHNYLEQESQRIGDDMALASVHLLCPVKSYRQVNALSKC